MSIWCFSSRHKTANSPVKTEQTKSRAARSACSPTGSCYNQSFMQLICEETTEGRWTLTLHDKAKNISTESKKLEKVERGRERERKKRKNQVLREASHRGRNSPGLAAARGCGAAGQLLLTHWCPAVKPEQPLQVGSDQTFDTSAAEPLPVPTQLVAPARISDGLAHLQLRHRVFDLKCRCSAGGASRCCSCCGSVSADSSQHEGFYPTDPPRRADQENYQSNCCCEEDDEEKFGTFSVGHLSKKKKKIHVLFNITRLISSRVFDL